jgi:hypothetical protein
VTLPLSTGLVGSLKLDVQPGDITDDCVAAGIARLEGVEVVAKPIELVAHLLFECIAALSGGLSRTNRPTVAMMLGFLHDVYLEKLVLHHVLGKTVCFEQL